MNEHDSSESLCKTCRNLHRMTENFQEIDFGTVAEIQSRRTCPVCRLVLYMLPSRPAVKCSLQQQISPSPQRTILRRMGRDGFIIWQDSVIQGELDYFFPNHQIGTQSNWWSPFEDAACETPNTLDYVKVNLWITKCDSDHVHCAAAHSVRRMRPPRQTFFIDVIDNCLVYRDTSVRYFALSYVWGNTVMFKTTSSNSNALQEPGAFLRIDPPLSPVIRDAIEVSRGLGERYIWIDALCIPQDNEIEKAELIAHMDSIYAQAFLTIVALSADSAESPLPGVRQGTRLANIASVQVSLTSTDERLPNKFLAVRPSLNTVLQKCSYNSRGWTFQESCLSRRCLVFTDHETFFHCDSGLESDSGMSPTSDAWPARNILSSVFETQENSLDVCNQYSLYTGLVFDFSRRKLTYPEDSLKAISGIFAVLSSRFGWRFVAGMPSHLLDHALLWRLASPNRLRNSNFPSWSWAGWTGQSHWNFQNFIHPLWTESENHNAQLIPLQADIEILQEHNSEALSSLDAHDNIRIPVLHVNVDSARMSAFEIMPVEPTRGLSDQIPIAPYKEIWTMDGLRCGILYDFQGDKGGVHKFIALSRSKWTQERMVARGRVYGEHYISWFGHICDDKKLAFSEYCLVNVMLVVTKETETERVGIGLIHNDVWRIVAKVREHVELR